MAKKYFSERNLKFLLYEVFDTESLTQYGYYGDHNKKSFDLVLNAAGKIAKDLLWPIFCCGHRNISTGSKIPYRILHRARISG